jgi:hypothetical protein
VSRASSPFFIFCVPRLVFGDTEGVGSRFHVLDGAMCDGSRFHVLHARTSFRRYRERQVAFSCFALPDSFSAISRALVPVFMFCAPGLVFGGIGGVKYRFHVLRARTHFRRYRGRRVHFSCFAVPDSFSSIQRASGPVLMFCAPGLIFDSTEGVGSHFRVLRSLTRFRRCRLRRDPFSCFARPDSFSAAPRASSPFFKFCAPGLIFGGT